MDKSIRKHRKKIRNKIDNLKSTNPKEYWKVLNSRRKQHSPDIPINIFLDYFKTLNLENPTEEENQNDIERLNIVLNSSITADEIQKSLKKLKNNKSSIRIR